MIPAGSSRQRRSTTRNARRNTVDRTPRLGPDSTYSPWHRSTTAEAGLCGRQRTLRSVDQRSARCPVRRGRSISGVELHRARCHGGTPSTHRSTSTPPAAPRSVRSACPTTHRRVRGESAAEPVLDRRMETSLISFDQFEAGATRTLVIRIEEIDRDD